MIKKSIFLLLISVQTIAQIQISGKVTGKKHEPLYSATVSIVGSYDGTSADTLGKYSFKTSEKGPQNLEISMMGYKTIIQKINIENQDLSLDFVLIEQINQLDAVVITAGAFEASDTKKAVAVLNSIDIATTGGSNADLSKAMNTMPGAQKVGEQEGLFVRGGTSAETKQFIDGTMVPNPFNASVPNIASRSRFSAFMFKGTVFTTGGYSALYGQAMSSALILESIDLPEKSQGSAFLSPIFVNVGYQELAKNKNNSWGINAGYTDLQVYYNIVKQKPDYFKMPTFYNGDFNYRAKTKNGMVRLYSNFGTSKIGLRRPDIDSTNLKDAFRIDNINIYNNFSWKENLKNDWKIYLGLGYAYNQDKISQEIQNTENIAVTTGIKYIDNKNLLVNAPTNTGQIKLVLEKRLKNISALRFGSEYWLTTNKTSSNGYQSNLKDNLLAVFAETDIYLSNNLVAKTGLRVEHSSLLQQTNIAPRVSMAYKIRKGLNISTAYGQFYQKPEDIYLFYNPKLNFSRATHYIANIQKMDSYHTFRIETFYKSYDNLVKIGSYNNSIPVYNSYGEGYAKGIELFWRDKKTFKGIDYWVSYSYLDTKRDYLNYPTAINPNFAARHTANVVLKKFVTSWRTGFNATYSFATGRPYYFIPNYELKIQQQGITNNYNSLDLSLNYLPNLGKSSKKAYIVIIASATNVLNQKQVYGYNFNYNGTVQQAVSLPAPHFYFVGCMISWGTDRTQETINNNL